MFRQEGHTQNHGDQGKQVIGRDNEVGAALLHQNEKQQGRRTGADGAQEKHRANGLPTGAEAQVRIDGNGERQQHDGGDQGDAGCRHRRRQRCHAPGDQGVEGKTETDQYQQCLGQQVGTNIASTAPQTRQGTRAQ